MQYMNQQVPDQKMSFSTPNKCCLWLFSNEIYILFEDNIGIELILAICLAAFIVAEQGSLSPIFSKITEYCWAMQLRRRKIR